MGLKEKRTEKGLTLQQLADCSGVHYMKIYQIETGKIRLENITLKIAVKLAKALDCSPNELLENVPFEIAAETESFTYMSVGEAIKTEREKAGLTQQAPADRMGVTSSQISQYERDAQNAGKEHLQKSAEALGVPVDVLQSNNGSDSTNKQEQTQVRKPKLDKEKTADEDTMTSLFYINYFRTKLEHIGWRLTAASFGQYCVSNGEREIIIPRDEIAVLNDKCDTYLKFLLSDL